MDLLVKRGAAWRDRDDWGWTVLHEAAASGHQKGQCLSLIVIIILTPCPRDSVGVQGEQGPDQRAGQTGQISPPGQPDGRGWG